LAHEKFTDPAIGRLLEQLRPLEDSLPPDSPDRALVHVARHDYEKTVKVPADFMAEYIEHGAQSFQAWTVARPADDFKMMLPYVEKTLELSRQYAEYLGPYDHIADPLIDASDEGMTVASVRAVFTELREQLLPIVRAIAEQPVADDACLRQYFPEPEQIAFALKVIKKFGFDFERGRQDKTHHPFETKFSIGDVRITTRLEEHHLGGGLFSTLHESGHAMYEQGVRPDFEGTPLANGTSSGVHESQSRLWENLVGRSRLFCEYWYPQLQAAFPEQLGHVELDTFYRAINKVERSLIRTEADEVTYNLHVLLRFDLELELLEGKLAVRDLPEAWRERYRSDLGMTPTDDRDGVLQDVHWFGGMIGGMFHGYTIGNILSAQFFDRAIHDHPSISAELAQGEYGTLHGWLTKRIYVHGRMYTAPELVERVTGGPMQVAPYIRYLRSKFGELYQL